MNNENVDAQNAFDRTTHNEFFEYYAQESLSEASIGRMKAILKCVTRNLDSRGITKTLDVADVGCNAGLMSIMWAQEGHRAHGLDVNEALLELARQRATESGLDIEFVLGSATSLPWADESMDACIAPELLEHVADWQTCISEFTRILKPGGVLVMSTSNILCPIQEEFNLPLYSWYPGFLKRHYEKLAFTTRPELAGYAKYPAVNWFSFYQLRRELAKLGMESYDRFDIMNLDNKSALQKAVIKLVRDIPVFRWLGHVASPWLTILSIKR